MSKLSDYSKFDHLDSDADDDENDDAGAGAAASRPTSRPPAAPSADAAASSASSAAAPAPVRGTTKKHPTIADRYVFSHGGAKVYEWEQSLEEVTICIDAPMDQLPARNAASHIVVNILPNRLQVGLRGRERFFLDERTFDKVKAKESSWYLDDDGVITIVLSKCFRGQTWEGVLCGHSASADGGDHGHREIQESIDPFTKQEMQRTLMLERFQEENPGFDFRDAQFNGEVPDPRTFMGGVGYH